MIKSAKIKNDLILLLKLTLIAALEPNIFAWRADEHIINVLLNKLR